MKRIISTVMICLFASITMTTITTNTSSQQPQMIEVPELKAGTAAPDLGLTAVLQSPDGTNADWASLKGKVVVLEFWATWCAPCIAVQPHLNELTDEFKDKSVQFISITN